MRLLTIVAQAIFLSMLVAACGGSGGKPRDSDGDNVANSSDCAPDDSSRWQQLVYQAVDADADSHPTNTQGQVCSGASLPAGYLAATSSTTNDCDDSNPDHWQLLAFVSVDVDGDGHRGAAPGEVCAGTTLPTRYTDSAPSALEVDCDDSEESTWRLARVYEDRDRDGVGSGPGAISCIGAAASAGFSMTGYDPLDDPADPDSVSTNNFDILSALIVTP